MEDLLANQAELVDSFNKFLINFKKDGSDRKTVDYFKKKLSLLEGYWNEFQNNHFQLCSFDKNHEYFYSHEFENVKGLYEKIKVEVNRQYDSVLGIGKSGEMHRPVEPEAAPEQPPSISSQDQNQPINTGNKASASKSEDLLRKQATNFKAFTRTVSNIHLDEMSEKWELESTIKSLQARWTVIDTLHWEIDAELNGSNEAYDHMFTKHEQSFYQLNKQINKKLWSVAHREQTTPKMVVPEFHGNYNQWTSFKDLFNETIHNNPSLSNAQKMQFLKSKAKGEAERLIQHLQISSDNYAVCWEILNHRFNNKKLIFNSHISSLLNFQNMHYQSMGQIKKYHDLALETLHAIKNLGVDISTWDPLLVYLLSNKLDSQTYNDYLESLGNSRELPNISDLLVFMETKFNTLESAQRKSEGAKNKSPSNNHSSTSSSKNQPKAQANKESSYSRPTFYNKSMPITNATCPVCKKQHGIFNCKTFLDMPTIARLKTINEFNYCKNCLYDHKGNECFSTKKCKQCNGNHNTLLHLHDARQKAMTSSTSGATQAPRHVSNATSSHQSNEILLATALVKVQTSNGDHHIMRALIDQGSQVSIITEKAAQLLAIKRQSCRGIIQGVGEKESNCRGMLNVTCSSLYSDFIFNVNTLIMNNLIKHLPNQSFTKPEWSYIDNIKLADPDFFISREVDLLLGADIYSLIMMEGIIRGEDQTLPIAQQTRLGWILCGNAKTYHCNVVLNNLDDIKQFWEIEDIAEQTSLSSEDQECLEFYEQTTTRLEDGRYVVKYPFKQTYQNDLGKSKPMAVAQLKSLERKFSKDENVANQYKAFISEYLSLGHMICDDSNITPHCFLPHHCVIRNESSTTKLRVVYNASAKTSSGLSLNDLMHRGPNLQQDLQSLIIKWRQFKHGFAADIEKMFRQILIHPDHRQYQQIVWRDTLDKLIHQYQLTTVTYGTRAAPFLAMKTLKQLAKDNQYNKHISKEAVKAVDEAFYMDDILYGSHSPDSALQLKEDLIKLMKSGGFNLRKWVSNTPELTESASEQHFDFRQCESTKTLGIRWNAQKDVFTFESMIEQSSKYTKRSLLSDISKLFDPLGWLSPLSTRLKLLFQAVFVSKINWDEELPDKIKDEWIKMIADIKNISRVEISRWIGSGERDTIELHGFCDASTKCYSCVIYCKTQIDQKTSIIMVAGKTKIVPANKSISIPRLELSGALLLSKLMKKVQSCLESHNINCFGWIDSTAVLGWLQGDPGRWKPFVSNRVREITESMPPSCWRYVKSAENPADCASRGLTAEQLVNHELWWNGPAWLASFKGTEKLESFETNEEMKKVSAAVTAKPETLAPNIIDQLLENHSSFTRSVRILAWILRFTSRKEQRPNYITLSEIKSAKNIIIKHVQKMEFNAEIKSIENHGKVDNKSKILSLNPFLDSERFLRVGGRLENANISMEMKHPIIIPHKSRLTDLIIDHTHKLTYHGGNRLTLSTIRQKYWIVSGNSAVKQRLQKCIICKKHNPIKHHQIMGDLPRARINPSRPFENTGVDFTGFFEVKSSKGRSIRTTKGYVAVFVCMVTRAVHLEIVSELTTSAFLAALRRMAARKGSPRHLYSDNGTNFVGANRILQAEYAELQKIYNDEFFTEITAMEIQWHFNAPSWPSAGGLWEAAVKSLKYHMKRVIGEQRLTFEEYSTLLSQLEACLNSRPLCTLSEDPADLDYLTPAHFLTNGPTLTIIDTPEDRRSRWHLTQKLFQDIWKRWRTEYLTQLTTRSKWRNNQTNMKVDDVVLIHDANLPAGKWALGRVTETHPGKDGAVRVVTLKTKSGLMKRPIIKLSKLPIHDVEEKSNALESKTSTPAEKRCRIKPPQQKSYLSMFLAFLFFISIIGTSQCFEIKQSFKNNQSLYFDKMTSVQLIRDEWKLVVYYNMEPYWEGVSTFKKYYQVLDKTCDHSQKLSYCDVILLQLQHDYDELEYKNRILLNRQGDEAARQKRGLINGVGYIAHSLFGTLDERFAEQYEKDINLVRENQNHLLSLWKNQTSILEVHNNILQRTQETINKQHKTINQNLNNLKYSLQRSADDMSRLSDITLSTFIAGRMLDKLKDLQDALLETITDLYHGKLNIHLLNIDQVEKELNRISASLPSELSLPMKNIKQDIVKIYKMLKVNAVATNNYFILEIRVPLISRDTYELYQAFPIPSKQKENMITVHPIAKFIAINLSKDLYIPMDHKEIQECVSYDHYHHYCYLRKPIQRMKSDNNLCEIDENTKQCRTYSSKCRDYWQELNEINLYMYFCCKQCSVRVFCKDQVTVEHLNQSGIISAASGCVIKGEEFTVYAHNQLTSEANFELDLKVPTVAEINHIINITLPFIETNETEDTESEHKLEIIKDQIADLKEKAVLSDQLSYHDVHHYAAIYGLGGVMLTLLCAMWLYRRRQLPHAKTLVSKHKAQRPSDCSDQSVSVSAPEVVMSSSASAVKDVKIANTERVRVYTVTSETDITPKPSKRVNQSTSPIIMKTVFRKDDESRL